MKRGRGHTKLEQTGEVRRFDDRGRIQLMPAVEKLGIKLSQDVKILLVKNKDGNPLNWEIKIVPDLKLDPSSTEARSTK